MKTIYQCTHCNSDRVQVKAWVRPNQGNKYVDEVEGDELGWCDDCELNSVIETVQVRKDAIIIGFQVVGDDGSPEAGLVHPQAQNDMEVYCRSQALSMLADDNGNGQWKLLSIWDDDIEKPVFMYDTRFRKPRD